jgi:two-component system, LytTR family, sensor histidine kinase AlgZ
MRSWTLSLTNRERRLIPSEMLWLYPFGPLLTTPMLLPNVFDQGLLQLLRGFAAVCVPFFFLSLTFHVVYTQLMPKLVWQLHSKISRVLLHVLVISVLALSVGYLVFPLAQPMCGKAPLAVFEIVCVAISGTILFPALVVQHLRAHAQHVERQAAEQRRATLEAQLKALQARTNPHFFFNSLNTVASLIPENPILAERTLERLADLFRYALDSSRLGTVALEVELTMVRDYLAIQSARFGNRLETSVEMEPGLAELQVPPLLLQPLVENAVMHGMASRPSGRVQVKVFTEKTDVVFEVRDDGPGPGESKHEGSQTSVREIGERIRLMYGEAARFALESIPSGGCLARLAIPNLPR